MMKVKQALWDDTRRPIKFFKGSNRWLSNFQPCEVPFEGLVYRSVEAAYQAAKFDPKTHPLLREAFASLPPWVAKTIGRHAKLPADWDEQKIPLMRQLISEKFKPHSVLAKWLVETYPAKLEEGNYHKDSFWGIYYPKEGEPHGENHLGVILMQQRMYLMSLLKDLSR